MLVQQDAVRLLSHFDSNGLHPVDSERGWRHMGATLVDAALQRRTSYRWVVKPRVLDLLRAWPETLTVSAFTARVETDDIGAVIRWRRPRKLAVLAGLTAAMADLGIETVADLRRHLGSPDLRPATVRRLRAVNGVGRKTVDYLAILAGLTERVAVDRHLAQFAADAGIANLSYDHLQQVYVAAAIARRWTPGAIDAAVWKHMTQR
jgi:endonuclease III